MTAPSPAGAPADNSRRCPGGCQSRIALDLFVCPSCWVRLPFEYQQPIQAAYRRDQDAYQRAVLTARRWFGNNPPPVDERPPANALAEQLQDMADMLSSIGRHAGHSRHHDGTATVCSCGVRVTRSRP